MADYTFSDLKTKYDEFSSPVMVLKINGKKFSDNKYGFGAGNVEIELTSTFAASAATFTILNAYDWVATQFLYDEVKEYIYLGSGVDIAIGYGPSAKQVFVGFISGVRFYFTEDGEPGVEVTAMDVKALMMSGSYAKQLTATSYSAAVQEILQKTAYAKLKSESIISSIEVADTPDKTAAASSTGSTNEGNTIEMVCESDYEFVVKAAKKYNFEFFTIAGTVYFREAKCMTTSLMVLGPGEGLRSISVGYDITGLVESVQVRNLDVGKAEAITSTKTISNNISGGSKAKSLLSKSEKVFIDPTVTSVSEAGYRANYLAETISYRYGSLEAEFIGLPELVPGRFIEIHNLGTAVSNKFYLTTVRHIMDSDRGFITKVEGIVASLK